MRMIIIESISTLVGESIMTLSLSPLKTLKPQDSNVPPEMSMGSQNHGFPASGVNSTDILRGEKAVAIHHNGLVYRLQATRLGKLIMTK